jgi:hypothetical protein
MQIEKIFNVVRFDGDGFAVPWFPEDKIIWRDIIRVGKCMVIDGLVDVYDYWAFQTTNPEVLIWVSINPTTDFIRACFSDAVKRQFGFTERSDKIKWNHACNGCNLSSYVEYPEADVGKPMYYLQRKHWWSQSGELRHALV